MWKPPAEMAAIGAPTRTPSLQSSTAYECLFRYVCRHGVLKRQLTHTFIASIKCAAGSGVAHVAWRSLRQLRHAGAPAMSQGQLSCIIGAKSQHAAAVSPHFLFQRAATHLPASARAAVAALTSSSVNLSCYQTPHRCSCRHPTFVPPQQHLMRGTRSRWRQ